MTVPDEHAATLWPRPRRRVLAITILMVIATVTYGAYVGSAGADDATWFALAAIAYLLATGVAAGSPPAVGVQVVAGFGLAWSALRGLEGVAVLALVPLVVGVVGTAELLGLLGRLAIVVERAAGPDLRRLAAAATLTAVISAVTLSVGLLDLPGGLMATVLAVGACVVLAVLLVNDRAGRVS